MARAYGRQPLASTIKRDSLDTKCFNCGVVIAKDDNFCFGCNSYICPVCKVINYLPQYHRPEDHIVSKQSETGESCPV